ncbi:MAG: hypothetical protein DI628_04805 [Blastochloris viridis]|uniref:Uncharacterized protein n=1 Tax=Blastochloris viridis TaxID=1079 RepID=A0A6N4RD66_BLAVI|nr:MAG: hypothetical protein DI628_04805 [Blastochloris viridis]
MTSQHADTSLAARHSRLTDDLQAMRHKYPPSPKPAIISHYSRKNAKGNDDAKIRRSNIVAVIALLVVGYLLVSGLVANIRWIIQWIF